MPKPSGPRQIGSARVHALSVMRTEASSTSVTILPVTAPHTLKSMAIRCLLFSSDHGTAQTIGEVLADLGIAGSHCAEANGELEQVTTSRSNW